MNNLPALFWVLIALVVEVQRDFCIQSNAKIVVHYTFLYVTVTVKYKADTLTQQGRMFQHPSHTLISKMKSSILLVSCLKQVFWIGEIKMF